MGHAIILYRDRRAIINDVDLWALRHFISLEAVALREPDIASFVRGWDRVGSGVWLGIEFESFFKGDVSRERTLVAVISAARKRIESAGEFVPLDYLAANINVPMLGYSKAQPVERLVQELEKLQELFEAA